MSIAFVEEGTSLICRASQKLKITGTLFVYSEPIRYCLYYADHSALGIYSSCNLTSPYVCRIFASTWNVGGKSPTRGLDLDDWLHSSPPADIYVLGYVFSFLKASKSFIT